MKPYPNRIYLSATWKGDARPMTVQLANLIAKYDVTVVRDDEKNKDDPLKESRTWVQRVDYMLRDCSGLVVVLPLKAANAQKTSPFLIPEILAADAQRIPILLFANPGVQVEVKLEGGELVVRFPNATSTNIVRFTDIALLTPQQNDELEGLLNTAGGFALRNTRELKSALEYPNQKDNRATEGAVQDFVEQCPARKDYPFVFNILPFSLKDSVHQTIASEVFKATGMACHISLDSITGEVSTRRNWELMLRSSDLVISELSSLRDTCLFETGCAIGFKKRVFVVSKHGQQALPFGLDDQTFHQYASLEDLKQYVRETCCAAHRREVFNLTNDFKALEKDAPARHGIPSWLDKKSSFGLDARLTLSMWAIFLSLAFGIQIVVKLLWPDSPMPNMVAVFSALSGFLALTRVGRESWEKRIGKFLSWLPWMSLGIMILLALTLVGLMTHKEQPKSKSVLQPVSKTTTK
jgi:hypothetical protein